MQIRLKYLISDEDRHGNPRYYVRVPGKKKKRIREEPHTEEFMDAYRDAMSGVVTGQPQAAEIKKGSFRHLCVQYFASDHFKALDVSTRGWQRRALEDICLKHGAKPVARMESRHVRKIRNEKTRAAANGRMKAMRAMFTWANEEEEFEGNPTIGVKNVKYKEKGHHTWTDDEIAQYYQRHQRGTLACLALDLIRFTTGRREDIPRFGPQHIKDGRFKYRQGKNEDRAPIDIDIPVHAVLAASIAACKITHMTFLVTAFGKPFTTNGFGNKFKDWCRQADLPHCSAHGVRKATATALAENEATPHQIGAITGHTSLKEIERYTKAAAKKKMATEGMAKLK
jgi:integrase/recombinase XerD